MKSPVLVKDYPSYRDIEAHHTSPEDAGRIFSEARPKLVVYSHIVSATLPPTQEVPQEALILRTRKTYDGPLVIGEDLMSFAISDTVKGQDASGTPIVPSRAN
jgi:ribonuclease Z